MGFLPITIPATFYLKESKADLEQVKVFLNNLHENFFSKRLPDGGSNEYYEAVMTFGSQTLGVRYVSPREGYDKVDRFVVTAFNGLGAEEVSTRVNVDLAFNAGEAKEDATERWLAATLAAVNEAAQLAGLPMLTP